MKGATVLISLAVAITYVIAGPVKPADDEKKIVCYYGSWAVYRPGNGKFDVEDLDPFACTHIIYGFVGLGADNRLNVLDPYNDLEENWGKGAMKRFTGLKNTNPNLKVLLAIGGWNEGSAKYSQMAKDPAKRRTFIESVVPFLQSQNFDGFDLDWEYPANREGAAPEDKENFVLLINELRAAFQPHGYLLTAAVSAGASTIDTAYDIPAVARGLDFINVMAYDFHGAWETYTGHHSPLGSNPSLDRGADAFLNSNYSIHYWMAGGAPANKLVMGTGTYGRGFLLDDTAVNGLYAPAANPIPAGPYTRQDGIWGYNEICEKQQAEQGQWTEVTDEFYRAPYAFNGRQWIGYDSPASIAEKGRYINAMGLAGGMVWSVETDDFRGLCHDEKFKLIKSLSRAGRYINEMGLAGGMVWSVETDDFRGLCHDEKFKLIKTLFRAVNGDYPPPPPTTTRDPSAPTQAPTTTTTAGPTPPPTDICKAPGLNPDPTKDCSTTYYDCIANADGTWTVFEYSCPPGTAFNPNNSVCDFPSNVPGC